MEFVLNEVEARVLGSLIEKKHTTPDYYPLTLKSLTAACNQKSSRNPIMQLDEKEVVRAIDELRNKNLVLRMEEAGGRVPKYKENIKPNLTLSKQETAIICILLLRHEQTVGELKTRSERIFKFQELEEVHSVLNDLMEREIVILLPRQIGQKEPRFMHLFCGNVETDNDNSEHLSPVEIAVKQENKSIEQLENEIAELRKELSNLKKDFYDFKGSFE